MQSTVAGREQPQQCECWTSEFFFDGFTNKRPPRRTRATGQRSRTLVRRARQLHRTPQCPRTHMTREVQYGTIELMVGTAVEPTIRIITADAS